jgi:hypothetical protein
MLITFRSVPGGHLLLHLNTNLNQAKDTEKYTQDLLLNIHQNFSLNFFPSDFPFCHLSGAGACELLQLKCSNLEPRHV